MKAITIACTLPTQLRSSRVHWTKPSLQFAEFNGKDTQSRRSKENSVCNFRRGIERARLGVGEEYPALSRRPGECGLDSQRALLVNGHREQLTI